MSKLIEHLYLPHVARARAQLETDPRVIALLRETDEAALLGFLIEFCARGVRMLRPVEGWMRRGGQACVDAGFVELGETLLATARGEGKRHLLLIDDLVQLAELSRARFGQGLDLGALVRREPPESARRHAVIREVASDPAQPQLTLGVELELAELALALGPKLIRHCERVLGASVFTGLRFVQARTEHAALHVDTWREHLDLLLRVAPEQAQPVAVVGSEALGAMIDFFGECTGQTVRTSEARSISELKAS